MASDGIEEQNSTTRFILQSVELSKHFTFYFWLQYAQNLVTSVFLALAIFFYLTMISLILVRLRVRLSYLQLKLGFWRLLLLLLTWLRLRVSTLDRKGKARRWLLHWRCFFLLRLLPLLLLSWRLSWRLCNGLLRWWEIRMWIWQHLRPAIFHTDIELRFKFGLSTTLCISSCHGLLRLAKENDGLSPLIRLYGILSGKCPHLFH